MSRGSKEAGTSSTQVTQPTHKTPHPLVAMVLRLRERWFTFPFSTLQDQFILDLHMTFMSPAEGFQ